MLYAQGFNPVLRVDVSDRKKFDTFFADLASFLSAEVDPGQYDGIDFQALRINDDITMLARHDKGQVVLTLVAPEDVGAALPAYTGSEPPDKTLSDSGRFTRILDNRGYQAFLVGFINWKELMSVAGDEDAPVASSNSLFRPRSTIPCVETIRAATNDAPTLVFGFERFEEDRVRFTAYQTIDADLAKRLDKAAAPAVAHDSTLFDGALAELIVAAAPFSLTRQLDTWARELAPSAPHCSPFRRLAASLPPELEPALGMRGFLASIGISNNTYAARLSLDAGALVSAQNPSEYALALSNALPVDLTTAEVGGDPTPLESLSRATPLGDVNALLRTGWLGLGLGERATAQLAQLDTPDQGDTHLAVSARLRIGAIAGALRRHARARLGDARDKQEQLDVSDADLETTKTYLDALEAGLPEETLEVAAAVELIESSIKLTYDRHGAMRYDLRDLNPFADPARYDAIRRVIRWRVIDMVHDANVKEAKIEVRQLQQMVESYYLLTNPHQFPGALEDLKQATLVQDGYTFTDPWGERYWYRRLGQRDFEIRSAGPDGEFETEDDIVSP